MTDRKNLDEIVDSKTVVKPAEEIQEKKSEPMEFDYLGRPKTEPYASIDHPDDLYRRLTDTREDKRVLGMLIIAAEIRMLRTELFKSMTPRKDIEAPKK